MKIKECGVLETSTQILEEDFGQIMCERAEVPAASPLEGDA
jgi:hypothetical protein